MNPGACQAAHFRTWLRRGAAVAALGVLLVGCAGGPATSAPRHSGLLEGPAAAARSPARPSANASSRGQGTASSQPVPSQVGGPPGPGRSGVLLSPGASGPVSPSPAVPAAGGSAIRPSLPDVPCAPDQYMLGATGEGGGGEWVFWATSSYVRGPACHLQINVTYELLSPDGRLLNVAGNPVRGTLTADLGPGLVFPGPMGATFSSDETGLIAEWGNWCEPMPVIFVVKGPSQSRSEVQRQSPDCLDATRPSKLVGFNDKV